MSHIQIESDTSFPFILRSNYQFSEMLTFSVTEGATVTFRWTGDGAPGHKFAWQHDMTQYASRNRDTPKIR